MYIVGVGVHCGRSALERGLPTQAAVGNRRCALDVQAMSKLHSPKFKNQMYRVRHRFNSALVPSFSGTAVLIVTIACLSHAPPPILCLCNAPPPIYVYLGGLLCAWKARCALHAAAATRDFSRQLCVGDDMQIRYGKLSYFALEATKRTT